MIEAELARAVAWRLVLLLGIGLVCNWAFYQFQMRKQTQQTQETGSLWLRFLTLAILAPIVFAPLFLGATPFTLLILMLIIISLTEWFSWSQSLRNHDINIRYRWQITFIGSGYLLIPLLFSMMLLIYPNPNGLGELVFFLITIQLADVGGIYGGLFFGKRRITPAMSPGKSWEGLLIGLGTALLTGYWFRFTLPNTPTALILLLAVLFALTSFMGDLWFSFFKRLAHIKDFGRILPGHGGVLDRFDGYLLAGVVAWLLFQQRWVAAITIMLIYFFAIIYMNYWLNVSKVVGESES